MMDFNNLPAKDKIYYQDDSVVIYCADCREVLPLFPDKSFDLVLTDPPYNTSVYFSNKQEMSDYRKWLIELVNDLERLSGNLFIFQSPKLIPEVADLFKGYNSFAAVRNFAVMGYGKIPNAWDVGFYKCTNFSGNGRNWCLSNTAGMLQDRIDHPTQKTVELISYIASLFNSQTTLDPFLGSGTTAVAAKILGRKCVGIEISEKYCEIAKKRCAQSVMQLEIPKEEVKQGEFISL